MKKALVVDSSNGMGLSTSFPTLKNYFLQVYVVDPKKSKHYIIGWSFIALI